MKRREFLAGIGAAVVWPLASRAQQQAGRTRRISALWPFNETDPDGLAELGALRSALRELGWNDIVIESRWGGGNLERTREYAAKLVGLAPDVIFARSNAQLGPLSRETRTIPIVFV